MYDIIGDLHGYCSKLKELLLKLDYKELNGVWNNLSRKVIFVGDYIDRGPEIRETLQLVKRMVEAGSAIALLGNHEYNAIAYARLLNDGSFLRPHNAKHRQQHQATIDQFADHDDEWKSHLNWFYTLPLFLDLGDLRVVHACWDQDHIEWLKSMSYFTLTEDLLILSHNRDDKSYQVINDTLKGREFNIPEKYTWYDKDGHARHANRVKWWVKPGPCSYKEFLFNCPESLMAEKVPADINVNIYPHDAPPVFFGHYWLEDKYPVIQKENVICLDYSVAKNGSLVAYRWGGEQVLNNDHFVSVR